jgi:hypothetical protein
MKIRTGTATLLASLLVASTVQLVGCSASHRALAPDATTSFQTLKSDYQQAQEQVEITDDALNELLLSPIVDLGQAYRTFSLSADWMLRLGDRLVTHADGMYYRGEPYLVEAQKSAAACVYPPVPKGAATKPVKGIPNFNELADQSWEVKQAYRAYEFDVSQIQEALSGTLTPVRVDALAPIFQKAQVDGESLEESLKLATAAVERARIAKALGGD